ncbi:MAG: hypothetical protein M1828_003517 [Chrysothrix sp. TS-e1954]|nr:MAG: hypothetical protein M1828_003517 [Chrysothrix sp. TS-e1954]
MANRSVESITDDLTLSEAPTPASDDPGTTPLKHKGRKRLLRGLHRISSSSSLLRLSRRSPSEYRVNGRGSISCVSLSSPTSNSNGFIPDVAGRAQASNAYEPAVSSMPATPGPDAPFREQASRIRFLDSEAHEIQRRSPATVPLPNDLRSFSRPTTAQDISPIQEDYFSLTAPESKPQSSGPRFDFWQDTPAELKVEVLRHLWPKEIIKCSTVSKSWHAMCFDGQLWATLDTAGFYREIPADSLIKIITHAGPFARDLNLRGCVQLWDRWRSSNLIDSCRNLVSISLEGCRIDRNSIHCLLHQNPQLLRIDLSGLSVVGNSTLNIIAQRCTKLEHLNVSWCNVDSRGLRRVVESCFNLSDLRANEAKGLNDLGFMQLLFERNRLERLFLMGCDSFTDDAATILFEGHGSDKDFLTGRVCAAPRRIKHLDFSRCRNIGDAAIRAMAQNVPNLEGLQLSKCSAITDSSISLLFPSLSRLTHLDLEELGQLSNASLQVLARSPCRSTLQHLSISYCENLGDVGMIPVVRNCTSLRSLELDNTRISDLVLVEAAEAIRARATIPKQRQRAHHCADDSQSMPEHTSTRRPRIGLRLIVYDCQNVTWTGIRAVLLKNTEIKRSAAAAQTFTGPAPLALPPPHPAALPRQPGQSSSTPVTRPPSPRPTNTTTPSTQQDPHQHLHPTQIIALKVFYGYQPTVTEHTRRVLSGNFASAARLERKWTEYMMASEEAGAPGGLGLGLMGGFVGGIGGLAGFTARRRRRRAREAAMMHADEEGEGGLGLGREDLGSAVGAGAGGIGMGGVGRRRRARSGGGCAVM